MRARGDAVDRKRAAPPRPHLPVDRHQELGERLPLVVERARLDRAAGPAHGPRRGPLEAGAAAPNGSGAWKAGASAESAARTAAAAPLPSTNRATTRARAGQVSLRGFAPAGGRAFGSGTARTSPSDTRRIAESPPGASGTWSSGLSASRGIAHEPDAVA